jgi:hypothetical protein
VDALVEGIKFCLNLGFGNIEIEGDSKSIIIDLLQRKGK